MSETETVKVELEMPRSLYEAITIVAEKFDLNLQELMDEFCKEILLLLEDE